MTTTLTLYTYWRSSSSQRVRLALGYKGLAYEPVFVNLLEGQQKSAENVARNPIGHVPTLVVDGVPYVESIAIMELLEELYPEPALLPKRADDRARVRALVETINSGVQPLQNLVVLEKVGDDKEKRKEWLQHFIGRGLAAFEKLMERFENDAGTHGPFAFGSTFTMADCCLLPQLHAARRHNVDLSKLTRITRAEQASHDLPFVKAASPEAQGDAKAS